MATETADVLGRLRARAVESVGAEVLARLRARAVDSVAASATARLAMGFHTIDSRITGRPQRGQVLA
jgi:hypothetical protein